jgi:hypothetical protein
VKNHFAAALVSLSLLACADAHGTLATEVSLAASDPCPRGIALDVNGFGPAPSMYGVITSSGRPKLIWSAVPDSRGYQLFRRYLPAEPDWMAVTPIITATTYTDNPNVVAGGGNPRYEYYVVSHNACELVFARISGPSQITSFKAANGGGPI